MGEVTFSDAMRIALNTLEARDRATGRTSQMLANAQSGDLIICGSDQVRDMERWLRDAKMEGVTVWAAGPNRDAMYRIVDKRRSRRGFRAVHFDHFWLLRFWSAELASSQAFLQQGTTELLELERPDVSYPSFLRDVERWRRG